MTDEKRVVKLTLDMIQTIGEMLDYFPQRDDPTACTNLRHMRDSLIAKLAVARELDE